MVLVCILRTIASGLCTIGNLNEHAKLRRLPPVVKRGDVAIFCRASFYETENKFVGDGEEVDVDFTVSTAIVQGVQ